MAEKLTIRIESNEDEKLSHIHRCNGLVLLAFGVEQEGEEDSDAMVIIERASIADMKEVIMQNSQLMQAACLAKGQMDAIKYGKDIELQGGLKKMLEGILAKRS